MTLRDVYWHCVQVNEDSDYCTLRNLVMWDAGEGPVKVTSPGHSGPYSDYGLIEDCVIGYTTQGMRDVVEGIDIVGSVGWVIRNCEFYNVTKGPDPDLVGYGFFAKGNSQDTVVEGCYFENCDIPLSFGGGGTAPEWFRDGDMTYEHRGGIMRNNVVNGTKDVAIYMNSAHDFKVYNNTLWSTFAGYDSSIDSRFNSSGEIANNICSQYYHLRDGGAATEHHNLWHASLSLFEDPGSGNFHLVSGATSAIDQGADLTADVPTDMDGQTRPIGAAVDIGADEYRTPTFSDVTDAHWAVRQVEACAAAGVVGGFPDGTYRPSLPVTRDQMAVYISRALAGGDEFVPTGPASATFSDVPTDHWAFKYVEYAAAQDIVAGYDDGTYRPTIQVDRAQMAVFIARAVVSPTNRPDLPGYSPPDTPTFPDVASDHWAYKYIEYIAQPSVAVIGPTSSSPETRWPSMSREHLTCLYSPPVGHCGINLLSKVRR